MAFAAAGRHRLGRSASGVNDWIRLDRNERSPPQGAAHAGSELTTGGTGGPNMVYIGRHGNQFAHLSYREVLMFDLRLSEEQRQFQKLARDFAQKEIKPVAMALDKEPEWERRVPWDLLKKGSQLGFRTFVLSEENGGSGMSDHLTTCLVAEELAAGEIGTAYYFMLTARRARDWFEIRMTPEQKAYFLPKFLSDDLFFTTVCIHEPSGCSVARVFRRTSGVSVK